MVDSVRPFQTKSRKGFSWSQNLHQRGFKSGCFCGTQVPVRELWLCKSKTYTSANLPKGLHGWKWAKWFLLLVILERFPNPNHRFRVEIRSSVLHCNTSGNKPYWNLQITWIYIDIIAFVINKIIARMMFRHHQLQIDNKFYRQDQIPLFLSSMKQRHRRCW